MMRLFYLPLVLYALFVEKGDRLTISGTDKSGHMKTVTEIRKLNARFLRTLTKVGTSLWRVYLALGGIVAVLLNGLTSADISPDIEKLFILSLMSCFLVLGFLLSVTAVAVFVISAACLIMVKPSVADWISVALCVVVAVVFAYLGIKLTSPVLGSVFAVWNHLSMMGL